jgi:hypothetical protein
MAEADCGATTIAVHRGAWADPVLAAMVAPPVVVSAAPYGHPMTAWRRRQIARSRANMPVNRHRRAPG